MFVIFIRSNIICSVFITLKFIRSDIIHSDVICSDVIRSVLIRSDIIRSDVICRCDYTFIRWIIIVDGETVFDVCRAVPQLLKRFFVTGWAAPVVGQIVTAAAGAVSMDNEAVFIYDRFVAVAGKAVFVVAWAVLVRGSFCIFFLVNGISILASVAVPVAGVAVSDAVVAYVAWKAVSFSNVAVLVHRCRNCFC